MLVPSFVNLGMTLDLIASCFLQVLLLATRLSFSFQNVGVSIFVFGVVGVVVVVVVSSLMSLSIVY